MADSTQKYALASRMVKKTLESQDLTVNELMDYAKKVIKDSNFHHGGFPFHTAYRDAESRILCYLLVSKG